MRKLTIIFLTALAGIAFVAMPVVVMAQMEFVQNKGQWHSNVHYKGDFKTGSFFLENKGFTVILHNPADLQRFAAAAHGHNAGETKSPDAKPGNGGEKDVLHSFAYKVKFLGASSAALQAPDKKLPTHNNYFIGSDPSKWATDCSIHTAITYKDVYPNIDVRYYSDQGKLKYDFIVKPGGNPDFIAMQYEGAEVSVKDKELIISTPVGEVKELYPYTYQSQTGKRQEVDCRFVVKNNVVTFKVGSYDPKATLIIDPSIIFSSFTGSTVDNWGYTATPGPDGSFYAGGIAFGTGYRVSPGAFQTSFAGGVAEGPNSGYDIAIFKFSANGSNRLYATYLGGAGNEQPHSMIADAQGNLILAGRSNSANYPLRGITATIGAGGQFDIIISKLNPSGTALLGSIKIGGSADDGVNIRPKSAPPALPAAESLRRNYGDDARSEVILDAANNIYLVSCTQSNNFPTLNAVQSTSGGMQDGVIMKFNSTLTTRLFSTYFGGGGDDACFVTNLSPTTGDLFVAGATASSDLPGSKAGVIQPAFASGVSDGFITQLRNDGSTIVRTTYQGTTGVDLIYGLKFDRGGFPYIMGTTTGNWTVVNASFANVFGTNHAKQFISKLQPDLSAYVYSTVFGTNITVPNISPIAFLVDRCENVYVSGWGGGLNVDLRYTTGTTNGLPLVNPLPGIPAPDGRDFYFFVLEKNAASQLFGSNFGQNGSLGDHVDGGTSRFDDNGIIYQAMCANCTGGAAFPTTPGSWATTNGSSNCNQAAVKIEMDFAGVKAGLQVAINSVVNDSTGCVPLTVVFRDTLQKGKTYYWNFGDGSPQLTTTTSTVTYTFNTIGTYRVRLIAEDSTTCNVRDTAYINIRVGNNRVTPAFTYAKVPPCESLTVQFNNTSTATIGAFGPRTFVWDYGDGSPRDTVGFSPARQHTYLAAGTYRVKLYVIDTSFCNAPDSVEQVLRLNPLVKAQFTTPATGCAPYTAVFENTSLAGTDFIWEFGDGTTSTDPTPTHLYSNPGTYQVRLIAIDTSTCNRVDTSAFFTITVVPKPTASFTWGPNPPIENTPVNFTNTSVGATSYQWNFGDGETSTVPNPVHQYNATGTYDAVLIAINNAGCSDTFSLPVRVIVVPVLDIPNAFTPGQEGRNAIIKVEGFGITRMNWKIYNRWGQLLFESTSRTQGWNGRFKGKLQAMDVYTYTLDAEFSDGKKIRKTGDITLLR
ncbi:MAG: PKD domain-containing protein [Sphingobacteriales bacterium]|nr:MAG: PKD domain-containing protein [Sphingobacteriales bacterium]